MYNNSNLCIIGDKIKIYKIGLNRKYVYKKNLIKIYMYVIIF